MTITSLVKLKEAIKIKPDFRKNPGTTGLSSQWQSLFTTITGTDAPAGATLSAGNTANGVIHTGATAGYPLISSTAFGTGNSGHLSKMEASSNFNFGGMVVGTLRVCVYDRIFIAGDYAFNASTTLTSQPSYTSRLPFKSDGVTVDYTGLEIWVEAVTSFTGTQAYSVNYTDQAGNSGHTTGAVSSPLVDMPLHGCWQLSLASGDSGVQKIESVTGSGGSVGTANIMVLRPLGEIIVPGIPNVSVSVDVLSLGAPVVFYDSALYPLIKSPITNPGTTLLSLEISVG